MSWWYIGLWPAYYFPLAWWAALAAPRPHEVIHVDFRRHKIVRVA